MITALRPDPDQAAVMERSGFYLCPNNGTDPCCQLGNRIVMVLVISGLLVKGHQE